ncbi:heterokaryon incompatibility protein-domain-containing protein [Hyaloscypha sp. PMI_1271]|nr:heterokaryon incompatibility protein-domain-containing protein [Hyaloscypha sp. PMI_1271]
MSSETSSNEEDRVSSAASYSELPIDPKLEIRILELLPPASPDPTEIHCNLTTARLADKPSYEALSYAWGDAVFPEKIYLPTGYLAITSNLAAALRQLRLPNRPRRLWVDAVCINQIDDNEKGHQVMLMAQIFSATTRAVGWLGEGNAETEAAIDIIKELASNAWRFGIPDSEIDIQLRVSSVIGAGLKKALKVVADQLDVQRKVLNAFLNQPWFSRLWVVQEACLPSKMILCNGSNTLNWNDLLATSIIILKCMTSIKSFLRRVFDSKFEEVGLLAVTQQEFALARSGRRTDAKPRDLHTMVYLHQNKACSNPVDKIYGLLGLKKADELIEVVVDYSRSIEEVYQAFTLAYLQKNNILILHYTGIGYTDPLHGHRSGKLPTWATDWRSNIPTKFSDQSAFNAGTSFSPGLQIDQITLPLIGVTGVQIGVVADETSTLTLESESLMEIWMFYLERIMSIKRQVTKSRKLYPTGEVIGDAFSRTLVLDNRLSGTVMWIGNPSEKESQALWTELEHAVNSKETITGFGSSGAEIFRSAARFVSTNRNFFITESGYFGMGPRYTKLGDVVVVFDGDQTPFVLRQIKSDEHTVDPNMEENTEARFSPDEQYELVGECYVHGFMDNEVAAPEWRAKKQTFWIR